MLGHLIRLTAFAILFIAGNAHSITADEVKAIASGEADARIEALNKAVATADDKTAAFLQALSDDAEDVMNNNRMRGELDSALAALKLFSKDETIRIAAIKQLQSDADETKLPLIEKAFAAEPNPQIKAQLGLVRAAALLNSSDKAKRLEAAKLLVSSTQANTKTVLLARLQTETEPDVKAALYASLRQVESALAWGDR